MAEELAGESLALMEFVTNPDIQIVMHLAKNVMPLSIIGVSLTDFVECDFPGYAPIVLDSWINVESTDEALGEVVSEYVEFIAGKIETPQLITAVYITKQITGNAVEFLWPQFLDIPLLISEEGQVYRKRFRLNSLADLEV